MIEEMKDGIIEPDSKFATEIGFTRDKFEGYLWKVGDYIYISLIKSMNPGHRDLSALFDSIIEKGFGIKVPTPLPRMKSISKRKGFVKTIERNDVGPNVEDVEVWVQIND